MRGSGIIAASRRRITGTADPYFSNVSLLLHMEGANDSTTFIDSSLNSFAVATINGNSKISTAQFKFGAASSLFDGSGDYLRYNANAAFAFPADFTVEFWVRFTSTAGNQGLTDASNSIVNGTNPQWGIYKDSSGNLVFVLHNGGGSSTFPWSPSINQWYHIAISRASGSLRCFIDGIQSGSPWSNSTSLAQNGLHIGGIATPMYLSGYLDEYRITKGVARYTANFTPPTGPFPNF